MKPNVIVLQTQPYPIQTCHQTLRGLGLVEKKDYVIIGDESGLEYCLDKNKRQLFITGTFRGIVQGVAEMVEKAREFNPQLACVSFSIDPLRGAFDRCIVKENDAVIDGGKIREVVTEFLAGTFNRTDAPEKAIEQM